MRTEAGGMALLRWTGAHLRAAAAGVVWACGGGIVGTALRRRFRLGPAALALLLASVGLGAVAWHVAGRVRVDEPASDAVVWGASLAAMACAGFAAASWGRTLLMWELQAVVLALASAVGWALHAPLAEAAPWLPCVGAKAFGPLWDRMLALWAALAWAHAVLGASWAVFWRGVDDEGRGRAPGLALSWRLARRHLSGRGRSYLSGTAAVAVLGIALGVAALVTTTGIMSGYQDDIRSRILGTNAHLVVQKYGIDFTAHDQVLAQALAVPGVRAGAPFVFNEAMLAGAGQATGVLLKGIDPVGAVQVTDVGRNLCRAVEGVGAQARCVGPDYSGASGAPRAEAADGDGGAALAEALAPGPGPAPLVVGLSLYQKLGLPLGSQVRLLTPVGRSGGRGNAARRQTFVLRGVFASGLHEFDSRLVYTDLRASQDLLGMGEAVSGVELRLDVPEEVEHVAGQVSSAIGHYPYRTLDWRQLNAGIFTALSLQKVVMFLVLTFIVVVASFNVASTLFLAVAQKAPQVAVLKAMGARNGTVLQTFLLEGMVTGVLGCGLGLLVGLLASAALARLQLQLAADVYMVGAVRVRLTPLELWVTAYSTLTICHFAALVPALGAARRRRAIDAPG